ncbi:MAG: diguanylate cyclase [Candidatus Izimaplasma sp.]|nr:diguanylate cyclase [Candidatus Izimaplasma bacterium]
MKTIGQFAKENKVTIKALHYYEKLDLINPTKVDSDTGYRYYTETDSLDLRIILFMKELGFSLSEIKRVMNNNFEKESLIEFMALKISQSKKEIDSTSKRIYMLDKIISVLKGNNSKKINLKELIGMSEKELYTGEYGHGSFIEETKKAFEQAKLEKKPLSIIQMDLDYFHDLNVKYGHDIGDIVLQRTSDEIKSVLIESDFNSLMERKGGDEYSVLVNLNPKDASKLATKILNRIISVDYSDVSDDLKVSITAGIAGITKNTKSYTELMHDATIKLYEAKRKGR